MGLFECECIQERCQSVFISEIIYSFIQYCTEYPGEKEGELILPKATLCQALSHPFTYILARCVTISLI